MHSRGFNVLRIVFGLMFLFIALIYLGLYIQRGEIYFLFGALAFFVLLAVVAITLTKAHFGVIKKTDEDDL